VLRRQSRRSGRFDYRVSLPGEVDSAGCDAELDNGVLRLRLPKTKSSQRMRIPVRGSSQPHGIEQTNQQNEGDRTSS
jgi:HSP20 family protein